MIAAKRYESVWNAFLKELPRNPTITLSSVQKKWHTNRKAKEKHHVARHLAVDGEEHIIGRIFRFQQHAKHHNFMHQLTIVHYY